MDGPKVTTRFHSHLREPQLEDEASHLCDARGPLLEALQVDRPFVYIYQLTCLLLSAD